MSCSIAKALDVVGDPWTLLIVRDALLGVTRFDTFASRLGLPRTTLSARLDHLVARGVMERRRYSERPPRFEYLLTEAGRALRPVVLTLMMWGDEWLRDDEPPTRLIDARDGHPIVPALVDLATGIPLAQLDVRAVGPLAEGVDHPA
jgi:DNA-binding HxlR family transcriptional regulator